MSLSARAAALLMRVLLKRRLGALHDPGALRAAVARLDLPARRLLKDVVRDSTILGGVATETFTPGDASQGALLYLHGGGFMVPSGNQHRRLVQELARAIRAVGYMPSYRLAPEHPYPAGLDDCLAAYAALLSLHPERRIVLVGDSAGGNLAGSLLLAANQRGLALPAAVYLISPLTDLTAGSASMFENARRDPMSGPEAVLHKTWHYLNGASPSDPLASPLYGDLSRLPPTLVHAGECEVMRDDSTRFVEKARRAGSDVHCKVWPGMFHIFPLMLGLPEARAAVAEAQEFLQGAMRAAHRGQPSA